MTTPISFTVRPPSAPNRPSPLGNGSWRAGPPSRRLFEPGVEEEEEEPSRRPKPRDEPVDGFANGRPHGYVLLDPATRGSDPICSGERPAEPLVIPAIPNRDWRQSSTRRTPSYRPENPRRGEPMETYERTGDGPQRSGLRYALQTAMEVDGHSVKVERTEQAILQNGSAEASASATIPVVKSEPLTLEEQALQAILAGDTPQESEEEKAQRELVIATESGTTTPLTEDDAFKRDVAILPEESTLDDYDAVPVSAFGMAMARGMGWNPSSLENTTIHQPKLRPQLLGLGATPMDVTVRPTHSRGDSKKKHQDRNTRSGRGFIATNLLVKKEREGEGSGSVTPAGSGSADESDSSRRRRREDDFDSGRESKRRDGEGNGHVNGDGHTDREGRRYETEEERARRKARDRERDVDRDRDRFTNGDRDRHTNGDREKYLDERRDRDDSRDRRRDKDVDRR